MDAIIQFAQANKTIINIIFYISIAGIVGSLIGSLIQKYTGNNERLNKKLNPKVIYFSMFLFVVISAIYLITYIGDIGSDFLR